MKAHLSSDKESICFVMSKKEFLNFIEDVETAAYHAKIGGQGISDSNYRKSTWKIWSEMTEIGLDLQEEELK